MADRLAAWSLASFNVAALTVASVLGLHLSDNVGPLLAGLDTLLGAALYLVLWATTWWSTRRLLAEVALLGSDRTGALRVLGRAFVRGALTGLAFLWAVVLLVYAPQSPPLAQVLDELLTIAVLALLASAFSLVVGGIVGLAVGALDLGLVALARWFTPPPGISGDSS